MEETVKANGFRDCYIRLIVTRGVGYWDSTPSVAKGPRSL